MSASSIGRHAPLLVSAGLIAFAPGLAMAQVPEDASVRDQVTFTEPGEIVVTALRFLFQCPNSGPLVFAGANRNLFRLI